MEEWGGLPHYLSLRETRICGHESPFLKPVVHEGFGSCFFTGDMSSIDAKFSRVNSLYRSVNYNETALS